MKHLYSLLICTVMVVGLSSCAMVQKQDGSSPVVTLNEKDYDKKVLQSAGTSVVLFYDESEDASQKMLRAYNVFARNYSDFAIFYGMKWQDGKDGDKYGLKILPTMVLFKNGIEIDRMKGVPSGQESLGFSDDLDLWMLKNVVEVKNDIYSGAFSYFFENTNRLHIGSH